MARVAGFSPEEWDAYVEFQFALQDARGVITLAEKTGKQEGRDEGLREGLRAGIEALCQAFGVEVTGERRREMEGLDAAGLQGLMRRVQERRGW